jgi:hypothetical protein
MQWIKTDNLDIPVYVNDAIIFRSPGSLMDTTVLGLSTDVEVTYIGKLHWLLGIQITFNTDLIDLSQEVFVDKILSQFQMNDFHLRLRPIDPNTGEPKEDSVLDAGDYHLYQSIIGFCM